MIRRKSEMKTEVREKMRGGDGAVTVQHYLEKEDFAAKVRLCAKLSIPAGSSIGRHTHEGEDEVYIVVRGSGLLDDGKTQSRVAAGDVILTGRGESHAIRCDTAEPLELIAMIMCY